MVVVNGLCFGCLQPSSGTTLCAPVTAPVVPPLTAASRVDPARSCFYTDMACVKPGSVCPPVLLDMWGSGEETLTSAKVRLSSVRFSL